MVIVNGFLGATGVLSLRRSLSSGHGDVAENFKLSNEIYRLGFGLGSS